MNIAAQSSLMVTDHQGIGKGDRVLFLPAPPPTPSRVIPDPATPPLSFGVK